MCVDVRMCGWMCVMKGTCQTVLCLLCADILHLLLSLPHLCCCPCCVVAPGALKTYPMNNWKSLDNGMRFCKSFALADARWSCGHIEVSISGSGSSSSSMGSSDGGAVVALLSLLPLSLLSLSLLSFFVSNSSSASSFVCVCSCSPVLQRVDR